MHVYYFKNKHLQYCFIIRFTSQGDSSVFVSHIKTQYSQDFPLHVCLQHKLLISFKSFIKCILKNVFHKGESSPYRVFICDKETLVVLDKCLAGVYSVDNVNF